jgi:hypothetical protein
LRILIIDSVIKRRHLARQLVSLDPRGVAQNEIDLNWDAKILRNPFVVNNLALLVLRQVLLVIKVAEVELHPNLSFC